MANILSEYLIRLGFQSDDPALSRFNNVLVQAEATVTRHVGGMAKKVLEAQGAIVGAFTGISSAIIGLVDKTAMADLAYQKTAVRMMMTKESARSLDMVTKALGASLEEIWWTPELRERAGEYLRHLGKLNQMLGPDFDQNMKGIRDFRSQFSLLEMDLKFLGMTFVSDIFKKLFPSGPGDALASITKWMDHFEEQIPHIANELADYAIPVLKTTWKMLAGLGEVLKGGAIAFTNLVGVFSGDRSIEGAAFDFGNLAKALAHVENLLTRVVGWAIHAEQALAHTAAAASLLMHGDFSGAASEGGAALKAGTPRSALGTGVGVVGGLLGLNAGIGLAKMGGRALGLGRIGALLGEGVEVAGGVGTLGWIAAALAATGLADWGATKLFPKFGAWQSNLFGGGSASASSVSSGARTGDARAALADARAALAAAIAHIENNKLGNNPGNLRYPGGGPIRSYATPGAGYQAELGQIDRNVARGLTLNEFFGGKAGVYPGWAPKGDGANDPAAYAAQVAKRLGIDPNVPLNQLPGFNPTATNATSSSGFRQQVDVGGVSVFITQPGAGASEIQRAVTEGVRSALQRQNQFDLAQLAPAWG